MNNPENAPFIWTTLLWDTTRVTCVVLGDEVWQERQTMHLAEWSWHNRGILVTPTTYSPVVPYRCDHGPSEDETWRAVQTGLWSRQAVLDPP
jgi:hypothetical protein